MKALTVSNTQSMTAAQVALIKRTVAVGATDDELAMFLHAAKRSGLDPIARQIYCIRRDGKMTIQAAIDGLRLIAERSGKYAGNDDPVFDNEEKPTKASVTVYRMVSGVKCAFTASARWSQYFPGDKQGFMWRKMPHVMLGKCAESLALRKAFPAEMSGIYSTEEMQQAGEPVGTVTVIADPVEAKIMPSQARPTTATPVPPQTTGTDTFTINGPFLFSVKGGVELRGPLAHQRYLIESATAKTAKANFKDGDTAEVAWEIKDGVKWVTDLDRKAADSDASKTF